MRCGSFLHASSLRATGPLLLFGAKRSWWGGRRRREKDLAAAQRRYTAAQLFIQNAAAGLGENTATGEFHMEGDPDNAGNRHPSGGFEANIQSAMKENSIDEFFLQHRPNLKDGNRLPLIYEIEARERARRQAEFGVKTQETHNEHYDEWNMPREPLNPNRPHADWEFEPTPEHKSLVLLLYRNVLKGLVNFKSVRRRSLIAHARFAFRRRANATEKLLIDECVEECRRAIYVIEKHHNFTRTQTYEFDTMTMPKNTGQDVKTYMEEIYDPEVSRMQFQNFTDVQPGKEHLHKQTFGPASGKNHWKRQQSVSQYNIELREEDRSLRPPPPPEMSN
ncbi:unnamed protein product [Phytomonas sp. Hart1]|nr:unnamed protein product [Phytomonas sp. Hart1]|eukprot:CCW68502.1 unnamed protein product [Phytomonas sp. isolate Hart1]